MVWIVHDEEAHTPDDLVTPFGARRGATRYAPARNTYGPKPKGFWKLRSTVFTLRQAAARELPIVSAMQILGVPYPTLKRHMDRMRTRT